MARKELSNKRTIAMPFGWFNPAKILSKNVQITAAADLELKEGQLVFFDETAKGYKAAAVTTDYTTALPDTRCVVVAEAKKVGTKATSVRCIYAGEVYVSGVRKAGHTATTLPDYVLDIVGGVSNINFVDIDIKGE